MRIVAASVFAAEVLLDLLPRERLVGVHFLAADPRYSLVADRVGDLPLVTAEPEAVLYAAPDLVVIDAFTQPETISLLQSAGVRLLQPPQAQDFAGIWANVRLLGKVCGREERAEELVMAGEERLAALAAQQANSAAWHLLNLDGGMHTLGRGSLFDAVLAAVGAHNVAADAGVGPFRKLDVETVLALPIDAMVLGGAATSSSAERRWLVQHPGLRLLSCVQQDRLLFVPGPLLGSTSHHLVDAAEHIAAQLQRWGKP